MGIIIRFSKRVSEETLRQTQRNPSSSHGNNAFGKGFQLLFLFLLMLLGAKVLSNTRVSLHISSLRIISRISMVAHSPVVLSYQFHTFLSEPMNGKLSKEPSSNSMDSNGSLPCKKAERKSPSPYRSEFLGRVVIVTGATKSLGRQIALSFGREGAAVTIQGPAMDKLTSIKDALLRGGADDRRVLMIVGHLHEESTAQSLFDRTSQKFGKIDTLIIVNSETPEFGSIESSDNFGENIRNLVQLSALATKHLAKTRGSIVALNNISSPKQNFTPWRNIYKGALQGWTRSTANALGPKGIRVNSINVGPIRSDFRSRQANLSENGDEYGASMNALGRSGTGEEVANIALFLASTRASFLTGQTLCADGGMEL